VRREGTGEASQATPNVEAAGEEVVQEDQHHGAVARARCAGGHQGKFFFANANVVAQRVCASGHVGRG
jgi:hypothetical protein